MAVAQLGPYIYLMNPYAVMPNTAGWVNPPPFIAATGVPAANPDELFELRLDEVEAQEYPGEWYFRGTERRVARAIRIPYIGYLASPNPVVPGPLGATLVRDYLLIGYEGMGGH